MTTDQKRTLRISLLVSLDDTVQHTIAMQCGQGAIEKLLHDTGVTQLVQKDLAKVEATTVRVARRRPRSNPTYRRRKRGVYRPMGNFMPPGSQN